MKRLRRPKLKDGELRMYWGREDHDCTPDVILAWQGDRMMKRDTNMLHAYMCSKHPDPFKKPLWSEMMPSMVEELEARGYDLTTLKFSIMKKQKGESK
jgi:hypothetical protein